MARKSIYIDIAIGLAAGLIATKVSDQAQRALWKATPESEKAREPDMEVSSAHAAARLLCEWLGIKPDEREIRLLKTLIHFGLGATWATTYVVFRRYGKLSPSAAASATGASLAVFIDEGINTALGITPPATAYPASAHVRGLATHLVYGAAVAAADEALQRAIRLRPS